VSNHGYDRRVSYELRRDLSCFHTIRFVVAVYQPQWATVYSTSTVDMLDGKVDSTFVHRAVGLAPRTRRGDDDRLRPSRAGSQDDGEQRGQSAHA
jgi:hypothetical protein